MKPSGMRSLSPVTRCMLTFVCCLLHSALAGAEPAPKADLLSTFIDRFGRTADALAWTDERVAHDWRLQGRPRENAARILDPQEQIVFAGSREECLAAFRSLEMSGQIESVTGETVIVLHGLGEGRTSMQPLVRHLQENLEASILSVGYASSRAGLEDHARALASIAAGMPLARPISFVGHSMGNLVVRRWLAMADEEDRRRMKRMVMLGPPNQGSDLARLAARSWFLTAFATGAARELVLHWDRVAEDLATPTCQFGIVAGGRGDDVGFTSLLAGDDDAVVRVSETRLEGADDFLLLPVHHARMMKHPGVQRATAAFLKNGRFPRGAAEPME
jgi:pimeloyl-ACP methyl ester carboxylesterase